MLSQNLRSSHTTPFRVGLIVLTTLAAGAVWILVRYWGTHPEYTDRFLILAAAGWVVWKMRDELAALPIRPVWLGLAPLLLGAVAYPLGWFLQAHSSLRTDLVWWIVGSWQLLAVGVILLLGSWLHLKKLAFPLGFLLFAVPFPTRIMIPLQSILQSATTTTAAAILPLLGVPVERNGYVLSLPGGDLGVVEACSGVRSVTALTAIAAFVAYQQGLGLWRGLLLLVLSIPLIAGVNATRVIISGLLQEHVGAEFVRGHWHDVLGVAMVLLGLLIIVLLAKFLQPGGDTPKNSPLHRSETTQEDRTSRATIWAAHLVAATLVITGGSTVFAYALGPWDEAVEVAATPLETIPLKLGFWEGSEERVPDEIRGVLDPDAIVRRIYRDLGYEAHVWVISWSSRHMVKGYHHPDVCWPNRGFQLESRSVEPLDLASGVQLPVTAREFSHGKERQLVLYWTQEGSRVWTEEDEKKAQRDAFSHLFLFERLWTKPPTPTGRLVVLVGTSTWGDGAIVRERMVELTRLLADEVYRVCPWAK